MAEAIHRRYATFARGDPQSYQEERIRNLAGAVENVHLPRTHASIAEPFSC